MEGTRVERKGREKVVACRRVERTAIVNGLVRGSRTLRGRDYDNGRGIDGWCTRS